MDKVVKSMVDPQARERKRQRALKAMKAAQSRSNLEKLPTELLEEVFFYCMNLNLPRSSPVIGGKLSSQALYYRLTLIAFGPTWDRQLEENASPEKADARLQVS